MHKKETVSVPGTRSPYHRRSQPSPMHPIRKSPFPTAQSLLNRTKTSSSLPHAIILSRIHNMMVGFGISICKFGLCKGNVGL
ncbi:hypothetical protein VIGAN_07149800 [Vigna angularis var. angularis]|uniref:Uncharacterized protein n=1 Tax=Vigna angularis var. angularis TaxID=157739 RepID=A0A0S3SIM0_PHAAN|nr:hypothetical protein VIGAN_07149800 [Vigna angularis var. angularis]